MARLDSSSSGQFIGSFAGRKISARRIEGDERRAKKRARAAQVAGLASDLELEQLELELASERASGINSLLA